MFSLTSPRNTLKDMFWNAWKAVTSFRDRNFQFQAVACLGKLKFSSCPGNRESENFSNSNSFWLGAMTCSPQGQPKLHNMVAKISYHCIALRFELPWRNFRSVLGISINLKLLLTTYTIMFLWKTPIFGEKRWEHVSLPRKHGSNQQKQYTLSCNTYEILDFVFSQSKSE
jgi:hypothetical protein